MDPTIRGVIESIGILSFALTGVVVAHGKGVNPGGIFLIAVASGLGGGTLRDIMLDVRPFRWEAQPIYIVAIILLTIAFVFVPRVTRLLSQPKNSVLIAVEVVAVASLGIGGADLAASLGQPFVVIALYGMISGAFGGVIRDVAVNELPVLFRPGVYLAGALFLGSFVFALLDELAVGPFLGALVGAAIIMTIRTVNVLQDRRAQAAKAQEVEATDPIR